jgi:hypothetical protein
VLPKSSTRCTVTHDQGCSELQIRQAATLEINFVLQTRWQLVFLYVSRSTQWHRSVHHCGVKEKERWFGASE